MSISISCPDCMSRLTVSDEDAGGMAVCSECDREFEVPVDAPRIRSKDRDAEDSDRPRRKPRERDDTDDNRPRKRRKKTRSSGPGAGLFIGIGVGMVVIVGVIIGAIYLVRGSDKAAAGGAPAGGGDAGGGQPAGIPPILPQRPQRPAGWIDFREPNGMYTVLVPSLPRPRDKLGNNNLRQAVPAGRMLLSQFVAETPELHAELWLGIYSPELVDGVREAVERKGPLASLGPNRRRTSITWAGRTAFEDTGEAGSNNWLVVKRFMWIGNRSYAATLSGMAPGHPTDAERAAFFDSFIPEK